MKNAAFPVSELTFVLKESFSDGLALALREGISGKLFSHLLDPKGAGREAFHAAVFKWAASDLPQLLDDKRLFDTFALLFLDGLKTLHRFFPDATPVAQTLADASSFCNYLRASARLMSSHCSTLDDFNNRLRSDYDEMRIWFSERSLVGEALRHIGDLCKRLVAKGLVARNGSTHAKKPFGSGPQTAFMKNHCGDSPLPS